MSVVYYKFKSSNEFDTVTFDGIGITLADFRKAIYGQKKLGKPSELDEIQVKNAQTQEGEQNFLYSVKLSRCFHHIWSCLL
jgi:E3 ubiquitin-protein ligase RBBP6